MDAFLTRWADKLLTNEFLRLHLIYNYSLLALSMFLYLAGGTGEGIIAAGATPGAIIFLVTLTLYAYRRGVDMLPLIRMLP